MKYYIQNGNTKLVKDVSSVDDAGMCMIKYLIDNHIPMANINLVTWIFEGGFSNDLIEAKMNDVFDSGEARLTSSLLYTVADKFYEMAQEIDCEDENEEDALYEKYVEKGDACNKLMDFLNEKENSISQTNTPEANLILELAN